MGRLADVGPARMPPIYEPRIKYYDPSRPCPWLSGQVILDQAVEIKFLSVKRSLATGEFMMKIWNTAMTNTDGNTSGTVIDRKQILARTRKRLFIKLQRINNLDAKRLKNFRSTSSIQHQQAMQNQFHEAKAILCITKTNPTIHESAIRKSCNYKTLEILVLALTSQYQLYP